MSARPLLDFVLVGPFKTGTSWMDVYLRELPGAALPRDVKETFFFSQDSIHEQGPAWFDTLFADAPDAALRGEVGPSYFHSEAATARLHALAPDCRVICSFREPAARLHSFYLHLLQRGEIPAERRFLDVLDERPFLLETARYGTHLARWQERFGRERVTVLAYEDLVEDRERLIGELCAGIGLDPVAADKGSSERINESMMPADPRLSRAAYGLARRLRGGGHHRLVNLAKRSGVRRLLLRHYDERPSLSEEEREAVYARLGGDLDLLDSLTERTFPWRARGV